MKFKHPSNALFQLNRQRFSELMKPNSLAIFYTNDLYPKNGDQFHLFKPDSDFYYLTGIDCEDAVLLLCPDHAEQEKQEILFIKEPSALELIWDGEKMNIDKAKSISAVPNIQNIDNLESTLRDLVFRNENIYLNVNEYSKFSSSVPSLSQKKVKEIQENFPLHKFERSAPILTQLRMIKSQEEIQQIQKACDITKNTFIRVLETTKPDLYEYQVEANILHQFMYEGSTGAAYDSIVATGKNACTLHYTNNDCKLKDGDLILFDFGAEYGYYASDLSRTIPVNGKFTPRQKECYNAVLNVFNKASELFVEGNTLTFVNAKVKEWMQEECIKLGLFTKNDLAKQSKEYECLQKYFMHGVSHHIGLNVHDVFDMNAEFKAGMVFTCEPGLYINEENIGIRIENDILVTKSKPKDLMESIPIEVEEIEAIMSK